LLPSEAEPALLLLLEAEVEEVYRPELIRAPARAQECSPLLSPPHASAHPELAGGDEARSRALRLPFALAPEAPRLPEELRLDC
jgi:hypothetical protein